MSERAREGGREGGGGREGVSDRLSEIVCMQVSLQMPVFPFTRVGVCVPMLFHAYVCVCCVDSE